MKDYYIYYNNNFVRQRNATLSVLSASTQFGLNVFEGIRIYKEDSFYVFRLEDHLKDSIILCIRLALTQR